MSVLSRLPSRAPRSARWRVAPPRTRHVVVSVAWDQAALENAVEWIAWGAEHRHHRRITKLAARYALAMRDEGRSGAEAAFAAHLFKAAAHRHLVHLRGLGIGSSKWSQ